MHGIRFEAAKKGCERFPDGCLRVVLDGKLLHDEADLSAVPGSFVLDIYADVIACVETVEYADLDGMPESEALELLGIGEK